MTSLRERAQRDGTPLIDDDGGAHVRVTFVWLTESENETPPRLRGDFNFWRAGIELTKSEPQTYTYCDEFPRDAYIEYGFFHEYDIDERAADPHNPRITWNGFDSVNHYVSLPDYRAPDLTRRGAGVARGAISEHWLEAPFTGDTHRKLYLYHPPTDEAVPLVIVWDGGDYLRRGTLNIIVDNLIAQGRIRPVALALLDSEARARYLEYMQSETTIEGAIRAVLPFAAQHLNLIDAAEQPGIHGVLGSSMGGLMALYTALRQPTIFGRVLCQSGAFWPDPAMFGSMLITQLIRHLPAPSIRVWQDCGTLEWLIDGNRWMRDLLLERGYDLTYREYHGGHNHIMWRDNTWRGLETLYPPLT